MEDSININMPILQLSCVGAAGIAGYSAIMNSVILKDNQLEEIRKIVTPRVTCTSESGYPYYKCVVLQIPYKMIESSVWWVRKVYDTMVSGYGQEKVDVIIPKDPGIIIDNIKSIVNSIFDKEPEYDRMMVQFTDSSLYEDERRFNDSMEDLIDSMLREYFNVEMRYGSGNVQTAIISKKENTDE